MKINGSQKIRMGIFVVAGLGILFVLIFFIGKKQSLFSNTFRVYADYKNVSGLQIGNAVRFGGITVGTVDDINIKNDSTIRVDLILQEKVRPYIKNDSRATIGSDGLMGDKLIQVSSGSDSGKLVANNGAIIAVNPMDMDRLVARLGGIAENAESITGDLADIFSKVNNGQGTLGRLLNDDKLGKNLEQTIQSANKTVKTIDKAADGVNQNMEAAKHNFLFRGYFKKKEKQRIKDSTNRANHIQDSLRNVKTNRN